MIECSLCIKCDEVSARRRIFYPRSIVYDALNDSLEHLYVSTQDSRSHVVPALELIHVVGKVESFNIEDDGEVKVMVKPIRDQIPVCLEMFNLNPVGVGEVVDGVIKSFILFYLQVDGNSPKRNN